MQTVSVYVEQLGLFFPFSLPDSVIAYRTDVSGSLLTADLSVKIFLHEPSEAEASMPRNRLRAKLESEGYSLARFGVIHENMREKVNPRQLAPIVLQYKPGVGWDAATGDMATIREITAAMTKTGSRDLLEMLAAIVK